MSGVIHLDGDFTIDMNFTFVNAIVFVTPGVKITVNGNDELTLDNAKLFCCSGMWQGIVLEEDALIETMNVTEIEDAWNAIDIPCRGTHVRIGETVFNRNYVGIRVGHVGSTPFCIPQLLLDQIEFFSGNTFSCTQALNDLQAGQAGLAGIQILGSNLKIGHDFSQPSTFRNIRFGILSEALTDVQITTLIVSRCDFEDILNTDIFQERGTLTTRFSNFTNCFANGIRQDFSVDLTVTGCDFEYNDGLGGAPTDLHSGISVDRFELGCVISVNSSDFVITHGTNSGITRGIYLNGGISDVADATRVYINNNDFTVETGGCYGILLEGDFTNLEPSSFIADNNFHLFNPNSYAWLNGITLFGDYQGFVLHVNDFFGRQRPDLTLNAVMGLSMFGAGNSLENEISSNTWHLQANPPNVDELASTDIFFAMRVFTQDMASICYNEISNVAHAATLQHLGHSVFGNNDMNWMAHGPHIEAGMIGPQPHRGNQWTFPPVEVNGLGYLGDINLFDGYHARCSGNPTLSLFTVHTPQATVQWDVDHPFHPRVIIPDLDDEFFEQQNGSPQLCPLDNLTGEVPDFDKWLADGNPAAGEGMTAAELWLHQRNLYRLLQTNPSYLSAYGGFPSFVSQHQNGNIGKFYTVRQLIEQAFTASTTLRDAAVAQQQCLLDNIAEIIELDNLLHGETDPSVIASLKAAQEDASEAIDAAHQGLEGLQTQYDGQKGTYYQQALSANSQISVGTVHETNEKTVNQIELNAVLNQGGGLTEQDVTSLNNIAVQCPKTGGTAVIRARALLEDCYEDEADDYTAACMGEFSTQGTVSLTLASAPRNAAKDMSPTSAVIAQGEIILSLPFEAGSNYQLYDVSGRVLMSGILDESLRIPLTTDLMPGVYFCAVFYPRGIIETQKIVFTR